MTYLKLGLNPYSYQSPIGVGYLMIPYNTLAYNLFYFTGENFLETAILLKVVGSFFLLLSGLFLYLIMNDKNIKYSGILFLAFIFNPFLIFINMVGPYTSIIPIAFFLGSYYFINRAGRESLYKNTLISVILLMFSVFIYYFYIVLLPTFIIYNIDKFRGIKQRFIYAITFILIGILFLFPILKPISLSSFVTNIIFKSFPAGGLGATAVLDPYSIYNLVSSNAPSIYYEYLVIVILSVMIPLILKKLNKNDMTTMFIVMALSFLLSTSFISPDYLVVLIPIAYLVIGNNTQINTKRALVANVILSQLFLIPQFFILVLRNGTNGLVGFYYWGYYFIKPVLFGNFYHSMGGNTTWKSSLLIYLLLLLLSSFIILKSRVSKEEISGQTEFQFKAENIIDITIVKRTIHILILFILIIIIISESIFISNQNVSNNNLNLGFFSPSFYNQGSWAFNNYAIPTSKTFEISSSDKTITFFPSDSGVSLFRNVSGQNMKLNITYNINSGSNLYCNLPLLLTNYEEFSINSTLFFNQSRQLYPINNNSQSNSSLFNTSIYNNSITYKTNQFSELTYNLNFKKNSSVIEYAKLSKLLYFNTLFTLESNNTILQLGILGNEIWFGINLNNTWKYINSSFSFNPKSVLTSFIYRMENNTFMADINGQKLFLPGVNWEDDTTIISGRPSIGTTGRIGICGNLSNLKLAKGVPYFGSEFLVNNTRSIFPFHFNTIIDLEINTSIQGTYINLENRTIYQSNPIAYIWIGPLGSHMSNISVTFNFMQFSASAPDLYVYFSDFILICTTLVLSSAIVSFIFKKYFFRGGHL